MAHRLSLSAVVALTCLFSGEAFADTVAVPASRAQDFVSAEGINTHVQYWNTAYVNEPAVIADLSYLGINHVRDTMPFQYGQAQYNDWTACLEKLAQAGIKILSPCPAATTGNVMTPASDIPTVLQSLKGFMAAYPGTVFAIQGLNEPPSNFSYANLMGEPAQIAFQQDMYKAVKADVAFRAILKLPRFNGHHKLGSERSKGDRHERQTYIHERVQG